VLVILGVLAVGGPRVIATEGAPFEPDALEARRPVPRRLVLGVSMLPDRDIAALDAFTGSVGRAPAIWTLWSSWGDPSGQFPDRALLEDLEQRGVMPMINWQPVDPADPLSSRFRYRAIANGMHDPYIRAFARAARDWGGRFLLRFAFEMNGPWFPWSIERSGNTSRAFVAAWRHVRDIFRDERATNARSVWSVYVPCNGCRDLASLYPGDRWVDFVAFDAFEWRAPTQGMARLYQTGVRRLQALTAKPILVTETGVSVAAGDKAAWIAAGYPEVYRRFPSIRAIVYFNIEGASIGEPEDWRLTSPMEALDAYRSIVSRPRFQGTFRLR
jgi:hypothetical protein